MFTTWKWPMLKTEYSKMLTYMGVAKKGGDRNFILLCYVINCLDIYMYIKMLTT